MVSFSFDSVIYSERPQNSMAAKRSGGEQDSQTQRDEAEGIETDGDVG